ncbi:unnamed protein product [Prunus brigantina]
MAEAQRQVREFATPTAGLTSICCPTIDANNFEIKPAILSMIQHNSVFCGLPHKDPNTHISNFLEICDTFKINGPSSDAIRLRLFPFSLKEKAKSWLTSQPPNSITTWDDLATKFWVEFFPPATIERLRNEIMTFAQFDKEQMYEAWERYEELLRKCPYHELPKWMQVQTFYNGLNTTSKTLIDAAAGGALMAKTQDEAYEFLETMASNNYQWPSERAMPKKARVHDVDAITALTAQISTLSKQLGSLNVNAIQTSNVICEFCAGSHSSADCNNGNPFSALEVNQVGDFNR